MCSAKTFDKQMRKVGVLNGEVIAMDLSKKPSLNLSAGGVTDESMKSGKEMRRSEKNMLYFKLNNDLNSTYDQIENNGDENLLMKEY